MARVITDATFEPAKVLSQLTLGAWCEVHACKLNLDQLKKYMKMIWPIYF